MRLSLFYDACFGKVPKAGTATSNAAHQSSEHAIGTASNVKFIIRNPLRRRRFESVKSTTSETVSMVAQNLAPTRWELLSHLRRKHGPFNRTGKRVRLRIRFGHFTANDYYETLVSKLLSPDASWLDVGCGRDVFPNNRQLAGQLATRCAFLQGVDPDATIHENPFLHLGTRRCLEDFQTDRTFDLVTMRMVAEHVTDPERVVRKLAELTRPGGKVVVYTPNKWSPISLAAWFTPHWAHHPIKRFLWSTLEKDTFPVYYRMNTRRCLNAFFAANGFRCVFFRQVACCSIFSRFRPLYFLELAAWRLVTALGGRYPENCLLGVYERSE